MISVPVFRKAMHDIAAKKGAFTLFGLFMPANGLGNWDLVVAAPWLEEGNPRILRRFIKLLRDSTRKRASLGLARVQIVGDRYPSLKTILKDFPVDDGEKRVGKSFLFGLEFDDAIILRACSPKARPVAVAASSASSRNGR